MFEMQYLDKTTDANATNESPALVSAERVR